MLLLDWKSSIEMKRSCRDQLVPRVWQPWHEEHESPR